MDAGTRGDRIDESSDPPAIENLISFVGMTSGPTSRRRWGRGLVFSLRMKNVFYANLRCPAPPCT